MPALHGIEIKSTQKVEKKLKLSTDIITVYSVCMHV